MSDFDETTAILYTPRVKWYQKKSFKIGVSIFAIVFIVLVCTPVAVYFGYRASVKRHRHRSTLRLQDKDLRLRDILPPSFGVQFNVTTDQEQIIKWENDKNGLKYQEIASYDGKVTTELTVTDTEAVIVYRQQNESSWQCFPNVDSLEWFPIVRLLLDSKRTKLTDQGCDGDIWRVSYNKRDVYSCVVNNDIVFVRYDNMTARRQKWNVPSPLSIRLSDHNVTCNYSYPLNETSHLAENDLDKNSAEENIFVKHMLKAEARKPECLFIHGVGSETPKTGYNTVTKWRDYWGEIETVTPQCSSHQFIQFNTVDNGWDSGTLHEMFCKFAAPDGTISNKILISHSMGNNIIAAALHRDVCQFDTKTSKWYSISAPWKGSKIADKLSKLCSKDIGLKNGHISPDIVFNILKLTKYCTHDDKPAPAFHTLSTSYVSPSGVSFSDAIAVAKKYVSGALCGTSSFGIGKNLVMSGALEFAQFVGNLNKPNDGLVDLESCDIFDKFQSSYKSKFYKAAINHLESTTRYECSRFFRGHPCKWLQHL